MGAQLQLCLFSVYPKKTFIAFSYPYLSALIPTYPNLSRDVLRRRHYIPLSEFIMDASLDVRRDDELDL